MLRGRNGGKGEREQYLEGVTILSLVMCSRWNGWRSKLMCGRCAGGGETAASFAADMR